MQSKSTSSASRPQTCPVLTLQDEELMEPCESVASTSLVSRKLVTAGFSLLMAAGFVGCSDDKAEPCQGDECLPPPCEGEECTPAPCEGDECPTVVDCLAIVTASKEEGALAVFSIGDDILHDDITTIHKDAGLTVDGNDLYVINRLGADNIQKLSIQDGFATQWQYSVGATTNPQSMAIDGDNGFIPLYGGGRVMITNLRAETEEDFVRAEALMIPVNGPEDGSKSEVANAITHNGIVYVISQGIGDDWSCAPGARSHVLAFDAKTFAPANVFDGATSLVLETCNAEGMAILGDTLYVQSIGAYRLYASPEDVVENDGAIEAIDLNTGKSLGAVLTEASAGDRDIFTMYPSTNGTGMWIVLMGTTAFELMSLHYLDLSTSTPTLGEELYVGYIWSVAEFGDNLYISERTADADGVMVIDKTTGESVHGESIAAGLPPRAFAKFSRENSCF